MRNMKSYYVWAAVILMSSMVPLFVKFEQKKSNAREVTLVATFIALAVVSRAAFYLIPQVKPIAAVVIAAAVCLGPAQGYCVGVFAAFISNFVFGQGYWTPFQMAALGAVGLMAGVIFNGKRNPIEEESSRAWLPTKWRLASVGFVLAFAVYGVIVDLSTVLVMLGDKPTVKGVLSVYAAGAPFSLVFGISTAVFLWLFGEAFIRKVTRVMRKYGI